jgi:hypothetical protein
MGDLADRSGSKMAYLNVRERRIETKIAYVGADLVGKATNLEALKTATRDAKSGSVETYTTPDGELLSLSWQPADRTLFRDCDVLVKIVAPRGPISELAERETLRDVDGVVIVMDARAEAREQNRESLLRVNEALERGDRTQVACVLQLNKSDLKEALAPTVMLDAIDASQFRHVTASATRGEGVIETLEAALGEVLARMQQEQPDDSRSRETVVPPANGDNAHPLLASLRQVLRETMSEYAAELELRVTTSMRRSLADIERAATQGQARASEELETLRVDVERLRVAVEMEILASSAPSSELVVARMDQLKKELVGEIARIADELKRSRKGWFT